MERSGRDAVSTPTFFTKAVTTVIGPADLIPYDSNLSTEIDWEVELAVIIGRRARNIHRGDAIPVVFGYTVLNDISARDLQYGFGGQFFYGKSLDGSCPLGPCIVTADELPDAQDLGIRLRVNGDTKQDARTSSMIVGVAENLFGGYVSTDFKDAFVFFLIIVVLIARPQGLLNRVTRNKV